MRKNKSIKRETKRKIVRKIVMLIYIEIIATSMAYIICSRLNYIDAVNKVLISLGIILLASVIYAGEIIRNSVKGVETNES